MVSENAKLKKSLKVLSEALAHLGTCPAGERELAFLSVAKAFEISLEYAWRELRKRVENEGIVETLSPKAVVREAARLGIIDEAEPWLDFIDARNAGVHDYFGMGQEDYVELAKEYLQRAQRVFF